MRVRIQATIAMLLFGTGCASVTRPIPETWLSVPQAVRIRSLTLDETGRVAPSSLAPPKSSDGPIRIVQDAVGPRLANGEKILTDPFLAIDSFSFSPARGEVAFSAKRDGDFDIGLVSSDGSPISWVPDDPSDEVSVQWAPRGSKISYVIRGPGGDVIRTLHVPTSFQFAIPFEQGTIHALAWDPPAEKFAVSWSTPLSSDAVDVLDYKGEVRKTVIPPAERLDAVAEPFGPGGVLLRPAEIRYGEKIPVVIWVGEVDWDDALAALMRSARVASVLTPRAPSDEVWKALEGTPWMDGSNVFVVAPNATRRGNETVITGDQALAGGRYRVAGGVVTVAPAVVQSFAARFIADHLTRTHPTNAPSSR